MDKFIMSMKIFLNVVLFGIYCLVMITFGSFIYGFYTNKILGLNVPGPDDFIHVRLAIICVAFVFIFTLIFRRFFYLGVFGDYEAIKTKKEKLEIYVNKEIKK